MPEPVSHLPWGFRDRGALPGGGVGQELGAWLQQAVGDVGTRLGRSPEGSWCSLEPRGPWGPKGT